MEHLSAFCTFDEYLFIALAVVQDKLYTHFIVAM